MIAAGLCTPSVDDAYTRAGVDIPALIMHDLYAA
jgi:hypothetical protein